jgi:hypothetical protein
MFLWNIGSHTDYAQKIATVRKKTCPTHEGWCLLGCYAVWRVPEDTILHSHHRENLKSYMSNTFSQDGTINHLMISSLCLLCEECVTYSYMNNKKLTLLLQNLFREISYKKLIYYIKHIFQ